MMSNSDATGNTHEKLNFKIYNTYERNKKREDRLAYPMFSHFICRVYGARCKHKYACRVHTVVIAARIIRVIKTHRNELECRKLSKVPAVGNFASFSWRCFLFLGTLSLCPIPQLCHSFSPLQKSIAHIIKLAAECNGKVPAAVNRRGENGAILSKNISCEKERPDSVN